MVSVALTISCDRVDYYLAVIIDVIVRMVYEFFVLVFIFSFIIIKLQHRLFVSLKIHVSFLVFVTL